MRRNCVTGLPELGPKGQRTFCWRILCSSTSVGQRGNYTRLIQGDTSGNVLDFVHFDEWDEPTTIEYYLKEKG